MKGGGGTCASGLDITELVMTITQCLDPGLETPVRKDLMEVMALDPVDGLFCDISPGSDCSDTAQTKA